ncbi:restriction endonuclease subunit S [Geobacillus sp. Geo 8.1]
MMMKKIGEVCELVSGYAFKSSEFKLDSQKGLPIIRIQNVGNPNSDFVYWESSYDEKFLVNEEDILLSLSGSVKVDIWKGPKALLNQRIVKIIPKSCVNKKWIYWAIHKTSMRKIFSPPMHENQPLLPIMNDERKRIEGRSF